MECVYSLELPRRDGSNKYSQFMVLSRNKKNNVYLCKSQFYYIKVGFKGEKIYDIILSSLPFSDHIQRQLVDFFLSFSQKKRETTSHCRLLKICARRLMC